ncbi:uncharacterized protein LOC124176287 [Neodiprion fabricii]|uniref:uncharacterized protein LOC124176287 n=1 Tax=Neodiprion fabricii TaxID=2872261 RepID=UPI001ED973C0|nr:uncharacterized protein LOC124176287 [Neodiprion fabricii]
MEDFEDNNEEDQACWNVTQDDSYTVLTGKYESMNPDCLEDEDDEQNDFLEKYLLSMSPIIEKNTEVRGEKGKKGTLRTMPRRLHDVSVKCSDSTEEIVGTPSEVALRLSDAIQRYLPRRKSKIEKEVSKEAAVCLDEEFGKDEESAVNNCPDEEPPCPPEPPGCPGTYDRIRKMNVPCAAAPTIREIALGRKVRRPRGVVPTEESFEQSYSAQPIDKVKPSSDKDGCCCAKKKKREGHKSPPPPPKSCCTTRPTRSNKNVTFTL